MSEPVQQFADTERVEEHTMTWDGPFGKTYIERCSCGWSAMTFADTRETAIGKAHDAHLAEVQQSDGEDAGLTDSGET